MHIIITTVFDKKKKVLLPIRDEKYWKMAHVWMALCKKHYQTLLVLQSGEWGYTRDRRGRNK